MSGLSNDDFRNILSTTSSSGSNSSSYRGKSKSGSHSSHSSHSSSHRGHSNDTNSNSTKSTRWIPKEDKPKDPNYRDRAEERRKGHDLNGDTYDDGEPRPHRGLDRSLLEKTRLEISQSKRTEDGAHSTEPKENRIESNVNNNQEEKNVKEIKPITDIGRSIYNSMKYIEMKKKEEKASKEKSTHRLQSTDLFRPGKMIYQFDLDPYFSQNIPSSVMLGIEDSNDSKRNQDTIISRIDKTILNKIINVYSPSNTTTPSTSTSSTKQNTIESSKNNNNVQLNKKQKEIDSDDDNIFSDAEEYVSQPMKPTSNSVSNNTKKKLNYFGSGDDQEMVDSFTPIGVEGDEYIYNNNSDGEDGEIKSNETNDQGPSLPPQDDDDDEDEYQYPDTDANYNNSQDEDDEDEYQYPDTDSNYDNRPPPQQPFFNRSPSDSEDEQDNDIIDERLKRKLEEQGDDYDIAGFDRTSVFGGFGSKMGERSEDLTILMESLKHDKEKQSQNTKEKERNEKIKKAKHDNLKMNRQMVHIDKILKDKSAESGQKYKSILDNNNKKNK